MLQKNSFPTPVQDDSVMAPAAAAAGEAIALIRRQVYLIVTVFFVTLGGAIIMLKIIPPEYSAHAVLIIDTKNAQAPQQQQTSPTDMPIDSSYVSSQVEILRSDTIARLVIKKLDLVNEFAGEPNQSQESASQRETRAVRSFAQGLSIARIPLTYIIDITYRSFSPDRAAQIANGVADAYLTDQLNAKYEATKRATDWLQDRINELQGKVSKSEADVVDFKVKNNIVNTGGADNRLVGQQQVSELSSQLIAARAATAEAKARLDRINDILASGSVNETVTDVLKSEVIARLRAQYFDLSFREADWEKRYGAQHLATVSLRDQMQEVRNAIFEEVKRVAATYESDYKIAVQRQDGLKKDLTQAVSLSQVSDSAQIKLRELESSAQSFKALYTNFLQRYTESVQQRSFPISEARLISAGTPPLAKSYPNTKFFMSMAFLLATVAGFGSAWIWDKANFTFRNKEDVELLLGVDCLALIPRSFSSSNSAPKRVDRPDARHVRPRTIVSDASLIWTVVDEPLSVFAESLRALKLSIDLHGLVQINGVIGFTSSVPDEGKSTVAATLAQLISLSGEPCVLVDCDLRNPSLSRQLAQNAQVGIVELVSGKCSIDDVVWTDHLTNMAFIPAVSRSKISNTADILGSAAMGNVFLKLRERYKYIIVDFSPVSPVVDVRATAHFVDSYVYVIEWGVSKPDVVQYALKNAPELKDGILGVVLNKVNFDALRRYGVAYKSYYNDGHNERYGVSGRA
jgi:polysaccharide biosynthesis transport protein